jgi:hypothetical protein
MDFQGGGLKDNDMTPILHGGDIGIAGPPAIAKDGDAAAGVEVSGDAVAHLPAK